MAIIEVEDLEFSYDGNNPTIDQVSFVVEQGQYVAVLGHNGSGKSTIAKLIMGLLEAKKGRIKIGGLVLNETNLNQIRSQMGIVFQNPDNQFIGSTVRDDIAFGLENNQVPPEEMDQIINEYAKKVEMIEFLDHEPTKLSGGQKQRVAIAGLLAMHPRIIILDEATSMLDPLGKRDINRLVRQINNREKITILSITHDIEEALLADKVIILNEGKVVKEGRPQDVLIDQKLMNKLKLDIPFSFKVKQELLHRGIIINENLDEEKIVEELWQLYLKK